MKLIPKNVLQPKINKEILNESFFLEIVSSPQPDPRHLNYRNSWHRWRKEKKPKTSFPAFFELEPSPVFSVKFEEILFKYF